MFKLFSLNSSNNAHALLCSAMLIFSLLLVICWTFFIKSCQQNCSSLKVCKKLTHVIWWKILLCCSEYVNTLQNFLCCFCFSCFFTFSFYLFFFFFLLSIFFSFFSSFSTNLYLMLRSKRRRTLSLSFSLRPVKKTRIVFLINSLHFS